MAASPEQIIIVSERPAVRGQVAAQLQAAGLDASRLDSCQSFIDGYDPDWCGCIVLDIDLPTASGLRIQRHLGATTCRMPVIFVLAQDGQALGVHAFEGDEFVTFDPPLAGDDLCRRIRSALDWHRQSLDDRARQAEIRARHALLSRREKDVMQEMVRGLSTKEIAGGLGLSPRTVEIYRSRVLAKMQARSVAELVRSSLAIAGEPRG